MYIRQVTSGGETLQDIMENQYDTRQLPKGQKFNHSKIIDSRKYSRAALGMHNTGRCSLKASGGIGQGKDPVTMALHLCLSPRVLGQ